MTCSQFWKPLQFYLYPFLDELYYMSSCGLLLKAFLLVTWDIFFDRGKFSLKKIFSSLLSYWNCFSFIVGPLGFSDFSAYSAPPPPPPHFYSHFLMFLFSFLGDFLILNLLLVHWLFFLNSASIFLISRDFPCSLIVDILWNLAL